MKSQKAKIFQKFKALAIKAFEDERFDTSLKLYSLALKYNPEDIDSKVGAILSDYAKEDSLDALSLYDYYLSLVELGEPKYKVYENILEILNEENSFLDEVLDNVININYSFEDGIEYQDFLEIAKTKKNMRVALEDLMFSSKLIIASKEEMMSFIELLYEYDFKDEAFIYLESAINFFPDDYFEEKFKKFLYS